jgi:uncharacterized protein
VIAFGTVLPGEPNVKDILHEAFDVLGLCGLKLHCHVQCLSANDMKMREISWIVIV